jgi:predicted nucleic acid-binding protein
VKLFIDTWGWLALRDRREARHAEVRQFYQDFRRQRGMAYTSDYVLDETLTLLFRRLPYAAAKESLEYIQQARAAGYLRFEWITPERFEKAIELRVRLQDKPRISFTDLTSMVVMSEVEITEILTEDDHFHQVGMGLRKVP